MMDNYIPLGIFLKYHATLARRFAVTGFFFLLPLTSDICRLSTFVICVLRVSQTGSYLHDKTFVRSLKQNEGERESCFNKTALSSYPRGNGIK